jgi:hypothetical protein
MHHVKGGKKKNIQEVMDVEKTVSPKILFGLPKDFPTKDCPVFRWSTAGMLVFLDETDEAV